MIGHYIFQVKTVDTVETGAGTTLWFAAFKLQNARLEPSAEFLRQQMCKDSAAAAALHSFTLIIFNRQGRKTVQTSVNTPIPLFTTNFHTKQYVVYTKKAI